MGIDVVAQVYFGGRVGVGVGALVAEKTLPNYWMVSIVWAPKQAKVAAGAGLASALARRLATPVAASEEDIAVMATLWGKNSTFLDVRYLRVSGT